MHLQSHTRTWSIDENFSIYICSELIDFSLIIDSKTILFLKYTSIIIISFQNFMSKSASFIITRTFAFVIWIAFSTILFWYDVYNSMFYNASLYFFI